MSFDFDGASSTLELGSALATAVPVTLACRFNAASLAAAQILLSLSSSTSVSGDAFQISISTTGALLASSVVGGTARTSQSSTPYFVKVSRWSSLVGVFSNSTLRQGCVDGVFSSTNGTSSIPSGLDRVNISGRYTNGVLVSWANGLLADVAIWRCALTPAEVLAYCSGTPPEQIQPQSLILSLPLGRDTFDRSFLRKVLSNTAAVANSNEPSVVNPFTPRRLPRNSAVASSGRTSTIAATEAGDVLAATAYVAVASHVTATETGDTFAANVVTGNGRTSTIAATEAGDTLAAAAHVSVSAHVAATEAGDTFAANVIHGTRTLAIAATEAGDSATAAMVAELPVWTKQESAGATWVKEAPVSAVWTKQPPNAATWTPE